MSKKENNDKDIDLSAYNNSGSNLWTMKVGLWLAQKRSFLLKFITVFLIALSAFFFTYSTYQYILYFLAGDPHQDFLSDNLSTAPRKITDDLILSPVQIFYSGDRSDLAVRVSNPNNNFLSTFSYCFYWLDRDVSCAEDFILPGEEKYLMALGLEISGGADSGGFYFKDIFWQRINTRQIPNWDAFRAERINFSVENLDFKPGGQSGLSDRINLNNLNFSIINNSPYGYYHVPLDILFFRGEELVGLNRHTLNNFAGGERRDVRVTWPGNLSSVSRVEIKPVVNIVDDGSYLPYRGESF